MKQVDKDVTAQVGFGDVDGEMLSFTRCVCGRTFDQWDFILGVEREHPKQCDCGRKLYFSAPVTVYEIVESSEESSEESPGELFVKHISFGDDD